MADSMSNETLSIFDNSTPPPDDCNFVSDILVEEIETRFWLNAVFGTCLASLGVLGNLLLAVSIFRQHQYRYSHFMYYGNLALCDAFVSLSYVLIHGNHEIIQYMVHHDKYHTVSLYMLRFWWYSFRLVFTVSHVCSVVASYLILAATFERYVLTAKKPYLTLLQRNRIIIALVTLSIGLLMKASNYFEFELHRRSNCTDHAEFEPRANMELGSIVSYVYFKFYGRTIVCTLVPFTLLLLLNVLILQHMRRHNKQDSVASRDPSHKARIKSATQLLVILVTLYLLGNFLNVFITIWEFVAYDSLTSSYLTFYTYVVDLISLLVVVSSVVRVPIYLIFNADMRSAVGSTLHLMCCRLYCEQDLTRKKSFITVSTRPTYVHSHQSAHHNIDHSPPPVNGVELKAPHKAPASRKSSVMCLTHKSSILDCPMDSAHLVRKCSPTFFKEQKRRRNTMPSRRRSPHVEEDATIGLMDDMRTTTTIPTICRQKDDFENGSITDGLNNNNGEVSSDVFCAPPVY